MNSPAVFPCLLLASLCLSATSVTWAEGRYTLMKLNYALRLGNAKALPSEGALTALSQSKEAATARDLLLSTFDKRWLNGTQGKLTPKLFTAAAKPFAIFGPGNQDLPKRLVDRGGPPEAASEADFISYLRAELPQGSVSAILLPKLSEVPPGTAAVVEPFRFLEDVARTAEADAVRDTFEKKFWDVANCAGAATYQKALAKENRGSWRDIRRRLGRHVHGLDVDDWSNAGGTLLDLAKDSDLGLPAFLRKAAEALKPRTGAPPSPSQTKSAERSASTGAMLEMLVINNTPAAAADALGLTSEDCEIEWFIWCHGQAGIVNHLLGNAAAARALTGRLIAFCGEDDAVFGKLFPMVRSQYYHREKFPADLRDKLFDDLLQPKARQGKAGAGLVLAAALENAWRSGHRHALGTLVFRGGEPDSVPWENGPGSRFRFADDIYRNLLEGLEPPSVQIHVEQELLGHLLTEHLRRFKLASDEVSGTAALDKAEAEFKPLLDYLSGCRRKGADLSSNQRLRRFRTELSEATLEVLGELRPETENNAAHVQRFVRRFKMALRVDRLVQPLGNASAGIPEWVKEVTVGLRTRVFGLPSDHDLKKATEPAGRVIQWSEDVLAFRAAVLVDITMDKDFREVLKGSALEQHVFEALLVPLVRVHGMLRKLCTSEVDTSWPQADWAKGHEQRMVSLFRALHTDVSLDCFTAVCALCTLAHAQPWKTPPADVFKGVWSVNADLVVFRWLLQKVPPAESDVAPDAGDIYGLALLALDHWHATESDENAWAIAEWIEHLLTAGEWQKHPFKIGDRPSAWNKPLVTGGSKKAGHPFRFVPTEEQHASVRTVNGQGRLRLVDRILGILPVDPPMPWLLFATNAAVLLPNSQLNDATGTMGRGFDLPKIALLRLVHVRLQAASDAATMISLLQCYLRLGAALSTPAGARENARGALPSDLPAPLELVDAVLSRHASLAVEVGSLREELRRLLVSRERHSHAGTLDMVRAQLDAALGHGDADGSLLPAAWSGTDRDLLARDYEDRLSQIGEGAVRDFLRLRRDVLQLLKMLDGEPAPEDVRRVQRFFGWVDWLIFYSRSDWKQGNGYLARSLPSSKGGQWWPALTLLCACTPALQDACRHDDLAKDRPLVLDLFRFNEAAIGTLSAIMSETDAKERGEVLGFEHELFWTELHLGILARTEHHDLANAATLAANAFHGAVRNVVLATGLQAAPDDAVLEERLFKSLDSSLGNDRRDPEHPIISLDGVVHLGALCQEDESLPASVRSSAEVMLKAAESFPDTGLLGGAASPGKVITLLYKLHDTAQKEPSPFWQKFYANALTAEAAGGTPTRLAASFRKALAQPFFRQSLDGQRGGIDSVVDLWRGVAAQPEPGKPSPLVAACRQGWGEVIDDLLHGTGREDVKGPFLWQSVTAFEQGDQDILKSAPTEFLTLAHWLQGFWRQDDPQPLKDYFNPMVEVAAP